MSGVPVIHATFEVVSGELTGRASAPVKRVETHDDGSYEVVIDHWPDAERTRIVALEAALADIEKTLEGHPDCLRGNSKVHYALMRTRNALRA